MTTTPPHSNKKAFFTFTHSFFIIIINSLPNRSFQTLNTTIQPSQTKTCVRNKLSSSFHLCGLRTFILIVNLRISLNLNFLRTVSSSLYSHKEKESVDNSEAKGFDCIQNACNSCTLLPLNWQRLYVYSRLKKHKNNSTITRHRNNALKNQTSCVVKYPR